CWFSCSFVRPCPGSTLFPYTTLFRSGFGGMRADNGVIRFAPRLPALLRRLAFRLRYRGRLLAVEVTPERTVYRLLDGPPLTMVRSEEHTSELQSRENLVCRLLLEKKK